MIHPQLIETIRREFALPIDSIHGEAHWMRVLDNGLRLAATTGADRDVVELFAFLHDSKRLSDLPDRGHGRRAAHFAASLRGALIDLPDEAFDLLTYACIHHTDGLTEADVTVQTCWDADRLDLGRVGIRPVPYRLCTAAAREPATIEWAFRRSREL